MRTTEPAVVEIPAPAHLPGCRSFRFGECRILVAHEPQGYHLSISHPSRYPTWDEIRDARYRFVPDEATMAMLLPPKAEYVNLHTTCFHLHEIERQS